MKQFFFPRKFLMFFLGLLISFCVKAQTPRYNFYVTNEVQISPRIYQFDIYLLRTGANPLEVASYQFALSFDTTIAVGGSITASYVSGSSEMVAGQVPTSLTTINALYKYPNAPGDTTYYKFMSQAARSPVGPGNGTIISAVKNGCSSPGTKIGTYRLTSTVDFRINSRCRHIFNPSNNGASGRVTTTVTSYVNGSSTTAILDTLSNFNTPNTCSQNIALNTCNVTAAVTTAPSLCFGTNNGSASITLSGFGSSSTGTYSLDGGSNVNYTSNPFTINNLSAGLHSVSIVSGSGANSCSVSSGNFTISGPTSALSSSYNAAGCVSYKIQWAPGIDTTVTTSGSYTRRLTSVNSCDSFVTANITINPTAPVAGTLSGNQDICSNNSVTSFSSTSSDGVWSSSNTAVATVNSSNGLITPVGGGTATITYAVTGTGGCIDSVARATRDITITVAPNTGTLSGSQAICSNATSISYSSTVTGGIWTSSNTSIATIDSLTGAVTPISQGVDTMTYFVAGTGVCLNASAIRVLTVTAQPSAGTLSGIQEICSNSSTTLSSTVSGGAWTSNNTSIATINSLSGIVAPVSSGIDTMTYTVTGTGGCANEVATRIVTITAAPLAGTLNGTQSVCLGSAGAFTSTNSGGYWIASNPSIATIDSITGVIATLTAGVDTMTYSIAGTGVCSSTIATATRILTVTAPPTTGTLSGSQAICLNGTATFSSSVSGGSWTSSNPAIATINSSTGIISPVSVGIDTMTYTVTGTGGCSNVFATRIVTITAPVSAGTITGNNTTCSNATTTYSSNIPGGYWTSSNTTIASIDSLSGFITPVNNASGQVTITYTVLGSGGCANATATKVDTIKAAPNTGTLSATQTGICVGGSATISTDGVGGGTWSHTAAGAISTFNTGTRVVSGVGAGVDTIKYSATANGCTSVSKINITITAAPVAGTINGTTSICSNANSTYTISGASSTGLWSVTNPRATIDSLTGILTPVSSGNDTVRYIVLGTGGCANATATKTIIITAAPNAGVLSASPQTGICSNGGTTTISTSGTSGTWSHTASGTIATFNAGTRIVTGVGAGTDTVKNTVTGSGGCANAVSYIVITVTTAPSAGTLSGTQAICSNGTTQFSSTVSGGRWTATNPRATIDSITGFVTAVSAGLDTMRYTVLGTGGCANATVTRTVNITAAPNAGTLSATSTAICSNSGTTTISTNGTSGTWSHTAAGAIATFNAGTRVVTGVGAGIDTVKNTVTGTGGCSNAVSFVVITITAAPTAGTLSGTQTVCANGGTTQFSSTVSGGIWSSGNTAIATVDSITGIVTGVTAGTTTISYRVKGTGGCSSVTSAPQTRTVTVNAGPNAGSLSGNQSICMNTTTNFSSSVLGGTWTSSNPSIATINPSSGLVSGIEAGSDTMSYTVTNGTTGCSTTTIRTIIIKPSPIVADIIGTTSICINTNTLLINDSLGGTWSSTIPAVATIDNSGIVNGIAPGITTINYTVTGTNSCSTVKSVALTVLTASVANAGVNQTISTTANAPLTGSVNSNATGGIWTTSGTGTFSPSDTSLNATYIPSADDVTAGLVTLVLTPVGATCGNESDTMDIIISNVIPVSIIKLNGYKDGIVNKLQWVTATESNNKGFEIQRSIDGSRFSSIGFVNTKAAGGNSNVNLDYTFTDSDIYSKIYYYRLRQVDNAGNAKLSNIVVIRDPNAISFGLQRIYPNPATSIINVVITTPLDDKFTVLITDINGKVVDKKSVIAIAGYNAVQFDVRNFSSGTYIVNLINNSSSETSSLRFIKQ